MKHKKSTYQRRKDAQLAKDLCDLFLLLVLAFGLFIAILTLGDY